MTPSFTALVFSLLIVSSFACSCIRPPLFQKAVNDAKGTNSPYAVAQVISEDRPADINGQVTYTLRTEGCTKTVIATTCGNSACCGVRLRLNTKYVLRLKQDGSTSRVNSCGVFRQFDTLSAADKAFVGRNVPDRCTITKPVLPPVIPSCSRIRCDRGWECRSGRCVRSPQRCLRVCTKRACPPGIMCNNCRSIGCPTGFTCSSDRRCVRERPARECSRRCLKIACRPGLPCPVCRSIGCPRGWECKDGKCSRSRPTCRSYCMPVQCFRAPCPRYCHSIGCSFGHRCVFGRCIPRQPWYFDRLPYPMY